MSAWGMTGGGIAKPPPPPPRPQQQQHNEVSPSTAHCFSSVMPSAVSSKVSPTATPNAVVSLDDLFGPIACSSSERGPPQSSSPFTHQDKVDTGMMNEVLDLPSASPPPSNSMGCFSNSHHAAWGGGGGGGSPQTAWPLKTPSNVTSSNFALDDFFSHTTALSSSSTSSSPPAAARVPNMIYVDDSSEECGRDENGINLMDLHPSSVQTTRFQTPETYLDKFECRGDKNHGRIGNATNCLEHLTRNHDENKVKARLLPLLSHYDVLGVPCDALPETIKRRYRLLAMSLHPDKTVGAPQTTEEEDLFKAITTAYEVLCDEVKRREYDKEILHKETV